MYLTRPRYSLLRELNKIRKEKKIFAAWAFQGNIYFKLKENDDKPVKVKNPVDFDVTTI